MVILSFLHRRGFPYRFVEVSTSEAPWTWYPRTSHLECFQNPYTGCSDDEAGTGSSFGQMLSGPRLEVVKICFSFGFHEGVELQQYLGEPET